MYTTTLRLAMALGLLWSLTADLFAQDSTEPKIMVIDTISIERNWRTKASIVFRELLFQPGDAVTQGQIDTSLQRVWNIGNFATVDHRLDTLEDGRTHLVITARDGFTIYPIIAIQGSKQDYRIGLGVEDLNFLGRNIRVRIRAGFNTVGNELDLRTEIPRQLLPGNSTLALGTTFGNRVLSQIERRERQSIVAFQRRSFYGVVGAPNHQDYRYTVSPNLEFEVFQHQTDRALLDSTLLELPHPEEYTYRGLKLALYESIGTVNSQRLRKDGAMAYLRFGAGIGFNEQSPSFQYAEWGAEYHKIFNRVLQISTRISGAHTTSEIPSLWYYRGANDIRGYKTGELSGRNIYAAYVGLHLSYVNTAWFALEHAMYGSWGNGGHHLGDWTQKRHLASVGTSFLMVCPMASFLRLQFSFTYSGPGGNWFDFQF
ncbi:hypothetical protein [Pontibacter sp. G13]|uniref:hypothetical protein n=1 Tax=Pontibacter sp. G13 TaxID=3074898 RepID=UPI00288A7656|nr:hypothetical protein [Pontibacter sp. G13]WNJ20300.1 hypothetical protein RJD25_07455 [Pontibacter sp. G13]